MQSHRSGREDAEPTEGAGFEPLEAGIEGGLCRRPSERVGELLLRGEAHVEAELRRAKSAYDGLCTWAADSGCGRRKHSCGGMIIMFGVTL